MAPANLATGIDAEKVKLTPIQRAAKAVHGQANLARKINVSASFVNQMFHGVRPIPSGLCKPIEDAVDRKVTCRELRPDIFGDSAA